jgi:hypothetical protein
LYLSWSASGLKKLDEGDISLGSEVLPHRICCFCIYEAPNSDSKLIPFLPLEGWFEDYGCLESSCSWGGAVVPDNRMVHSRSIITRRRSLMFSHGEGDAGYFDVGVLRGWKLTASTSVSMVTPHQEAAVSSEQCKTTVYGLWWWR